MGYKVSGAELMDRMKLWILKLSPSEVYLIDLRWRLGFKEGFKSLKFLIIFQMIIIDEKILKSVQNVFYHQHIPLLNLMKTEFQTFTKTITSKFI